MAKSFDMGLIGLGVMGKNFALNIVDKGFSVLGYDKDFSKSNDSGLPIATDLAAFSSSLNSPKLILILVPAGQAVDAVLSELEPHLIAGDVVVDSGNSLFKDTQERFKKFAAKGIEFVGLGISGGEEGARRGPSLMFGGSPVAYEKIRNILEASAAKTSLKENCVDYLGNAGAGHFVKMVHNGIEYGLMQLIAESYDLMKNGLGLKNKEISNVYERWNQSDLNSFLIEITSKIFLQQDPKTRSELVDSISDAAKQKGTGKWTVEEARNLQTPIPTIEAAVSAREISRFQEIRSLSSRLNAKATLDNTLLSKLQDSLLAASILTFAQGMAMLAEASTAYEFGLDLQKVAKVWRGGCIIRTSLLEKIADAYLRNPLLKNLILDPGLQTILERAVPHLRTVVKNAIDLQIPVPALMASLSYFDSLKSRRLPTALIQAQRDFFGAHRYERIDESGTFHTEWGNT